MRSSKPIDGVSRELISIRLTALMASSSHFKTQRQLAAFTGISSSTIGRIRRGEVNVTGEYLKLIAEAFEVPVSTFYGDQEISFFSRKNLMALAVTKDDVVLAVFMPNECDRAIQKAIEVGGVVVAALDARTFP